MRGDNDEAAISAQYSRGGDERHRLVRQMRQHADQQNEVEASLPSEDGREADASSASAGPKRSARDGVPPTVSIWCCRVDDRVRESFGQAAVAPVVHVQAV